MLSKTIRSILFFLLIFISSLYGYDLKIPIYIVSLFLFLFLLSNQFDEVNLNKLIVSVFSILFFLIYALFFIEYIEDYVSLESKDAIVGNFVVYLFVLFYISLAYIFINPQHLNELGKAAGCVLIMHVGLFFIQFVFLFASDRYVDFYNLFNSQESRYLNYLDESVLTKYRATGLFVEPSTYCSIITCLLCIYLSVIEKINIKYWIVFCALLSMLLSFSSAAYILIVFISLALFFLLKNKKIIMMLVVSFIVIILPVAYSLFDEVMFKFTATSEARLLLFQYLYFIRDSWSYYFGYGPLGIEQVLYTSSIDGSRVFSSLNDAGLINYFVVHFGIVGLMIPIFCLYKTKSSPYILFLTIALFLTKITYAFPLFIISIYSLLLNAGINANSGDINENGCE